MAKRKKLKLTKKQRQQVKAIGFPLLAGLCGLLLGIVVTASFNKRTPSSLVWPADHTVKIPNDLRHFLKNQNNCENYRGPNTPTGIALWSVYQTSKDTFAKIAYGCSWDLNMYIVAVKQDGKWQLIEPKEYFAPFKDGIDPKTGSLPFCAMVEKYQIPQNIESFCVNADGSAQANIL